MTENEKEQFKNEIFEEILIKDSRRGNTDRIDKLLEIGVNVNAVDENGCTPLMLASYSGHINTVKLLLKRGARVNASNHSNETALSIACRERHMVIARMLIAAGAMIYTQHEEIITKSFEFFSTEGQKEIADIFNQYRNKDEIEKQALREELMQKYCEES